MPGPILKIKGMIQLAHLNTWTRKGELIRGALPGPILKINGMTELAHLKYMDP